MKEYLEKFEIPSNKKVIVCGDFMLDLYLWGDANRVSPESPVPVVSIYSETESLGGAGNVVANLAGLNTNVIPVGILGDDQAGIRVKNMLESLGCPTEGIVISDTIPTTEKTRVIARDQQVVRIDHEDVGDISPELTDKLSGIIDSKLNETDVLVLSDYGKGICTENFTKFVITTAVKNDVRVIVDPKETDYYKYAGAYCITPNIDEAEAVAQFTIVDDTDVEKACRFIQEEFNIQNVILTRGKEGLTLYHDSKFFHLKTEARTVYDVSGAGDTVIATVAASLNNGMDLQTAINFANSAAGIVVSRLGTAPINFAELKSYFESYKQSQSFSKIVEKSELQRRVAQLKSLGRSIVFTNGCFDILHTGHISLLERAKSQGDILIVGLNSDNSVRRLKGENRPIISEYDRAKILAALEYVDLICFFDADTPEELIRMIKPDFLVKGDDYQKDEVVGGEFVESYGGEIVLVPIVKGHSTTKIIDNLTDKKS